MSQLDSNQATLHARRIHIGALGGLPSSATKQSVATFVNNAMVAIGGVTLPGHPVVSVEIDPDNNFAIVELRSIQETNNAMELDGVIFERVKPIQVRRPSDYKPSLAAALGPTLPNPNLNLLAVSPVGLQCSPDDGFDNPDCIDVRGIPCGVSESDIERLLFNFGGPLRYFEVKKGNLAENSIHALCVYKEPSVTDDVCRSLNGFKWNDATICARRLKLEPKHADMSDPLAAGTARTTFLDLKSKS